MAKRFLALLLCLVTCLSIIPAVQAEGIEKAKIDETQTIPVPKDWHHYVLPEAEAQNCNEQFNRYAADILYGRDPASTNGVLTNGLPSDIAGKLGARSAAIEQRLKPLMVAVADGKRTSTEFSIDVSDLNMDGFDYDALWIVYYVLVKDCSYAMYWHDIRLGVSAWIDTDGGKIDISVYVGADYAGSSNLKVNTSKISAVKTARTKAAAIVSKYASKSDLDKLRAYKDEICKLNEYNYDAADNGSRDTTYGINPWQLVYVFDGDPDTNVVCEGYSKAFQYLCDLSTFSSSKINCYCVSGIGHMWNVITMPDGRNYVVDVTWDDQNGAAAGDNYYFLAYATGRDVTDYTITTGYGWAESHRPYDEYMFDIYTVKDLTLSTVPYGSSVTKLKITTQPTSQSVPVGSTATFKVVASGKGLRYQWYYRTSSSQPWTKVSSKGTSATYNLTTKTRHNGYQYYCCITDQYGAVLNSSTVKLTVGKADGKPVITKQPTSQTVAVGKTATFKVTATGATSYQWQYRKTSSGSWTNVSSKGTSATYTLTTADRHNGYEYRCKVTNAKGSVYSSVVKLTVVAKPVITANPKSVSVTAGKTATFKVTATGDKLSYQWYYKKPGTSTWVKVSANGTSATYKLTTAARHNGYVYRCRVTNTVNGVTSSVYSTTATLTVK